MAKQRIGQAAQSPDSGALGLRRQFTALLPLRW